MFERADIKTSASNKYISVGKESSHFLQYYYVHCLHHPSPNLFSLPYHFHSFHGLTKKL